MHNVVVSRIVQQNYLDGITMQTTTEVIIDRYSLEKLQQLYNFF
jgi:hypothetical protein